MYSSKSIRITLLQEEAEMYELQLSLDGACKSD